MNMLYIIVMNIIYFNEESLADIQSIKTSTRNQCRICLSEVVGEHHQLCACKGHLQNIHLKCLLQWLKRITTDEDLEKGTKECEICKEQILLDIKKSYSCSKSLSDIIDNHVFKNHCDIDTKFALLLCLFFVPLFVMVGMIVNYTQNRQTHQQMIYLIVSLGFVSFLALALMFRCFFVKVDYQLHGVKQKGKAGYRQTGAKVAVIIQ